jgi:hypothetical protein
MVFNITFNNISVLSWQSVLLVEETGIPEKTTDLSQVTDKLNHILISFISSWYLKLYNLSCSNLYSLWWSYGSWIYNYQCNQCLSPLTLWVQIHPGKMYSIQQYVIKFVCDLRQVSGFLGYSCFLHQ